MEDDRSQAEAAVEKVRRLHLREVVMLAGSEYAYCSHCLGPGESGGVVEWPCDTIRVLGEVGDK